MGTVYLRNTAAPDGTYQNLAAKLTHAQLDNNFTLFLRNDTNDEMNGILTIGAAKYVELARASDTAAYFYAAYQDFFGFNSLVLQFGASEQLRLITGIAGGTIPVVWAYPGYFYSNHAPSTAFIDQDTTAAPYFSERTQAGGGGTSTFLQLAKVKVSSSFSSASSFAAFGVIIAAEQDGHGACITRINNGDTNNWVWGFGLTTGDVVSSQTFVMPAAYSTEKSASARQLCIENNVFFNLTSTSSTLRIKMNVENLSSEEASGMILPLRPVTYNRKKFINGEYVDVPRDNIREPGFLAEEVAQVSPLLATFESIMDENGNWIERPDGLSHANFMAPAIKVLQDLKMKNNGLRARIQVLREEIEALKIR